MALLIGTRDGVFRSDEPLDDAEHVLDAGNTPRVRTFDGDAYAATTSGLFRSADEGRTWTDLDVPREEVYSVVASPDGEYLLRRDASRPPLRLDRRWGNLDRV